MLAAGRIQCRSRLPEVNLFDIPELMPGAHSSATPAERMDFEQRCLQLHEVGMEPRHAGVTAATAADVTVDELEAMFPTLDPPLVRMLADDAGTPQQALETLLKLVAASAEPALPSPPPRDLGLEDTDAFPSLVDADGWQVVSQQLFDRNLEEDLGSAWRDRAKEIANKPAPHQLARTVVTAKKRASKQDKVSDFEMVQPETEYEMRHRRGKQRMQNRARFQPPRKAAAMPGDADSQLSEASGEEAEAQGAQNDPNEPAQVSLAVASST